MIQIFIVIFLLLLAYIINAKHSKKIKILFSTIILAIAVIFVFTFFLKDNIPENEWYVDYLGYEELHTYSTGESQKIALIDSGISREQSENSKTESVTLVDNNSDYIGHGTMMYSIIKGFEDQVIGLAPDVELLSIKVVNNEQDAINVETVAAAIDMDSDIINFSSGSFIESEEVSNEINRALDKGIFVVSSTGDYGTPEMLFPANSDGVVNVGALSEDLKVANFSSAPNKSLINAPGDGIKALGLNNEIEYGFGTSQATAIISGYISLLNDYAEKENIELTNDKLYYLLDEINKKNISYAEAFKLLE